MNRIKVVHGGLAVWLIAMLAGCQAPQRQPAGEASVHPGINDNYTEENLDVSKWVERFENGEREVYAQRERILAELRVLGGATVADIGAGTGAFTLLLAEAVGPAGKVYAVEIVPEFLLHIRQRAEAAGLSNVVTVLCGERSVDLPPNTVDLAFLCDVYHHFEYPMSTLASLRQAMRPGSDLVVIDFRRVEGESSDWVMEHVRADQQTVTREIQEAGFKKLGEADFLETNYFMRFRKPSE